MDRPKRRRRSPTYRVTLEILNASLSIGTWEAHWGGEKEAQKAWWALNGRLQGNLGTRPEPFWRYTPGIPTNLWSDGPLSVCSEEHAELIKKRLQWLLGEGAQHLLPEEGEVIDGELWRLALFG